MQGVSIETLDIFIGIVLGALLVMAWDLIKYRREAAKRERLSLQAIIHSIAENRSTCSENLETLKQEIEFLHHPSSVIRALLLLDDAAWQLLRLQLPRKIAANPELLAKIGYIFRRIAVINTYIASRETFRQGNVTVPGFKNRMMNYDNSLVTDFESLWQSLTELEQDLASNPNLPVELRAYLARLIGHKSNR
jgi:hypothetical protein